MFRVQSIPMVFAVVGGQPVDAFTGVLPEAQLRQWHRRGAQGRRASRSSEPEDPRLDAADDALITGDLDAAERAYKKILAESPADAAAEAGLAHVGLARRVDGRRPRRGARRRRRRRPTTSPAQLLAADVEVLSGAGRAGVRAGSST